MKQTIFHTTIGIIAALTFSCKKIKGSDEPTTTTTHVLTDTVFRCVIETAYPLQDSGNNYITSVHFLGDYRVTFPFMPRRAYFCGPSFSGEKYSLRYTGRKLLSTDIISNKYGLLTMKINSNASYNFFIATKQGFKYDYEARSELAFEFRYGIDTAVVNAELALSHCNKLLGQIENLVFY